MFQDSTAVAAVRTGADEPVDAILAEVAAVLRHRGLRICGIVQEHCADPDGGRPVTALRDLSNDALISISQQLGRAARGCRLDPGALAEAARRLESVLEAGVDLVVLNRFGKSEAEGGGMRPIIERAFLDGVPVLIAVRGEYVRAWEEFHGGMAAWLPADATAILDWCNAIAGLGRNLATASDAR